MEVRHSDLYHDLARIIVKGFDDYRQRFKTITSGAKLRFEQAEWSAIQAAARDRIDLFDSFTETAVEDFLERLGEEALDDSDWPGVKSAYRELIAHRADYELAETVFNTIYRRVTGIHRRLGQPSAVTEDNAFVTSSFTRSPVLRHNPVTEVFLPSAGSVTTEDVLGDVFRRAFAGHPLLFGYQDLERDIGYVVTALTTHLEDRFGIAASDEPELKLEIIRSVFYRNKGAYLIGRLLVGTDRLPIAVPVVNLEGEGLVVDAVIWDEDDLSIIFSFTRSYFMVDVDYPSELIAFLQLLLPAKQLSELYSSLGFYKHGKTEFYREFLTHLESSNDEFVVAPGIRGMVMTVFTLPSYEVVFKVIRDRFSATKKITRQQVRDSYYFVKTHDRVGRMADTQEFSDFAFPRSRFSAELIHELLASAASSVVLTDDTVIVKHLYIERRMVPLNLYIEHCDEEGLIDALDEYGNAIKQLAAANIFPGDMLLKNFGVTRHGRVVFYDYDEICYLTDVNFRAIPQSAYLEDELSAEPWFSVGPRDVFPEEFKTFLFNSTRLLELFTVLHGDIFRVDFWQGLQQSIRHHEVMDVFPYRQKKRFGRWV